MVTSPDDSRDCEECWADGYAEGVATILAQRDELLAALRGVVRIADRQTVEFDAARAAIAKAEGAQMPDWDMNGDVTRQAMRAQSLYAVQALTEMERQRYELLAALNRVLTILRDLDCPLDVRVTMAHDVADEGLKAAFAKAEGK